MEKGLNMKKGYVFTLDAAFAVIIVGVLLLMVYSYPITSYSSGADAIAIRRTASDIVAVLDYNDVLDTLDKSTIESELNPLLPPNLNMSMVLHVYNASYYVDCPASLADFDFVGCYDHTSGDFVRYPPEADPRQAHCNEYPDEGGLDLDPGLDSSSVVLWCNDIIANSDCDYDDVAAGFGITGTDNGVKVNLTKLPYSAGHTNSIIINSTFGEQFVELEIYNKDGPDYDEAEIICGKAIQINSDLDGDYYTGKWRFPVFTGSQIEKYVLVEYKVGLR